MKKVFVVMILFIVLLAGCSKDGSDTPDKSGKSGIAPLTGEKTDDAKARPIAVMVNNHTKARPQTGLSKADLVFEILAEGQITRFMAIYQSEKPEEVGPVRSAREYYFKLADGYDAIYVYHGAAKFVDKLIQDSGIDFINGAQHDNDGKLFIRSKERQAPHNSYVQFNAIKDEAKARGFDLKTAMKPLPFLEKGTEPDGQAVNKIQVTYSNNDAYNPVFHYDEASGMYDRTAGGEQTKELNTDDHVAVSNVFIVEASHAVFDDAGRRKIDLDSGGNAYLFQKGKMQKVEWENKNGRIVPIKDGEEIGFVPGRTWINIVPDNPGLQSSIETANE